jgi:proton glutamate symport protein
VRSPAAWLRSLSLPVKILLGASLGLLAGVFFGDSCAVLRPLGKAYVMCLQAPVYPYLVAALMHGVGVLQPAVAWNLVKRGGLFLLLLWGTAYALLFALAQLIPTPTPRLIDPAASESRTGLLELLIPANVDLAITHNYLPAVILFCIVFGAALQAAPNKGPLLAVFALVKAACVKVWNWVVRLAPLGVFALTADTVGTLPLAELHQAMLYLVLFFGGVLLLFWLLPALLTALAPFRYREIFHELRAPLALALVTTLSVAALPFIQKSVEKLAGPNPDEGDQVDISPTIVSLAYVFGPLGNGFVYLFILFATFYFGHPLTASQQVALPPLSVPASFGSPSASVNAVSFLAEWLGLPNATTGLYVELMTVTRYGQVAASVLSFFFLALLMALAYHGRLQVRLRLLVLHLGLLALVCGGLALAGHRLRPLVTEAPPPRFLALSLPESLTRIVEVRQTGGLTPTAPPGEDTLRRVWRTGTLRVGYDDHLPPFCYRNSQGQLVGYDVAVVYGLARALGVRLEFVPLHWERLVEELDQGQYDLALAAIYPGTKWYMDLSLTNTYHVDRLAVLVHSKEQNNFLRITDIESRPGLRLGVFANTMPEQWAAQRFPQAQLVRLTPGEMAARAGEWDAFVVMASFAEAWAGLHRGYVAVVPEGLPVSVPLSYLVRSGCPGFLQCLNHCLEVQQAEGFLKQQEGYWMRGQPLAQPGRRWCVARDLLSWLR